MALDFRDSVFQADPFKAFLADPELPKYEVVAQTHKKKLLRGEYHIRRLHGCAKEDPSLLEKYKKCLWGKPLINAGGILATPSGFEKMAPVILELAGTVCTDQLAFNLAVHCNLANFTSVKVLQQGVGPIHTVGYNSEYSQVGSVIGNNDCLASPVVHQADRIDMTKPEKAPRGGECVKEMSIQANQLLQPAEIQASVALPVNVALLNNSSPILIYPKGSCEMKSVGGNPKKNNYGAWPVCTNLLPANPLVYSFGIGGDVSFDVSMVKQYNARAIFCYDPTITPAAFTNLTKGKDQHLSFEQIGLGATDSVIDFYRSKDPRIGSLVTTPGLKGYKPEPYLTAPIRQLSSITTMLNHDWVDLIKLDVEGAEFDIFSQVDLQALPTSQLLIEFHARLIKDGWEKQKQIYQRFAEAGWELAYEQPGRKEETIFVRVSNPSATTVKIPIN